MKRIIVVTLLVCAYALFGWRPNLVDAGPVGTLVPGLPAPLPVIPCPTHYVHFSMKDREACVLSHVYAALQQSVEEYDPRQNLSTRKL